METKRKTGIRVDYVGATITWADITGGEAPIVIDVNTLADDIRTRGLLHGIDQKVTDAGAMGTDHWDGDDKPKRAATVADRHYVMDHGRVVDMIPNADLDANMAKLHDYLGV
jgi:hypothetical protein